MRGHPFLGALALGLAGCGSVVSAVAADAGAGDVADDRPLVGDRSADGGGPPDVRTPTPVERCPLAPATLPAAVTEPSVVSIASCVTHECAVYRDGTVRCRGNNSYGQLGWGTRDVGGVEPREVAGLRDVRQVIVSTLGRTLTLQADGTVRSWGNASLPLLGTPDAPDRCGATIPCSLRPQVVPGLGDVRALGMSSMGACAVRGDGAAWCWGSTAGLESNGATAPTRLTVGSDFRDVIVTFGEVLLRRDDGTLLGGFQPGRFGPAVPPAWEVAPGQAVHLCATLPDRTVRCWGEGGHGQLGTAPATDPRNPGDPGLDCVRSVARTDSHTCAVRTDGTVWCWGSNDLGQSGAPAEQSQSCPDGRGGACVLRPHRVEGIDHVESVFVGGTRSCALRSDRTVWCWGGQYGATEGSARPALSDL
jgi:alpha-tubulin suppressor-like RCC1 family protein